MSEGNMLSDEDVKVAWTVAQEMGRFLDFETLRAIMTKTAELLAARGGKMPEDGEHIFEAATEDGGCVWVEATGEWGHEGGNISWALDALAAHVVAMRAAQGACVGVLKQERDAALDEVQRLTESCWQGAAIIADVREALEELAFSDDVYRLLRHRVDTAEARVVVLEEERDGWRQKWEGATQNEQMALELAATREQERDSAVGERDALRARLENSERLAEASTAEARELKMKLFAQQHNMHGVQRREEAARAALEAAGIPALVELKPGISSSFLDDRIRHLAQERDTAREQVRHLQAQLNSPQSGG